MISHNCFDIWLCAVTTVSNACCGYFCIVFDKTSLRILSQHKYAKQASSVIYGIVTVRRLSHLVLNALEGNSNVSFILYLFVGYITSRQMCRYSNGNNFIVTFRLFVKSSICQQCCTKNRNHTNVSLFTYTKWSSPSTVAVYQQGDNRRSYEFDYPPIPT